MSCTMYTVTLVIRTCSVCSATDCTSNTTHYVMRVHVHHLSPKSEQHSDNLRLSRGAGPVQGRPVVRVSPLQQLHVLRQSGSEHVCLALVGPATRLHVRYLCHLILLHLTFGTRAYKPHPFRRCISHARCIVRDNGCTFKLSALLLHMSSNCHYTSADR